MKIVELLESHDFTNFIQLRGDQFYGSKLETNTIILIETLIWNFLNEKKLKVDGYCNPHWRGSFMSFLLCVLLECVMLVSSIGRATFRWRSMWMYNIGIWKVSKKYVNAEKGSNIWECWWTAQRKINRSCNIVLGCRSNHTSRKY
jgi:hypothetical protein